MNPEIPDESTAPKSSKRTKLRLLNVVAVIAISFGGLYVLLPKVEPTQQKLDLPKPGTSNAASPPLPITPSRFLNTASSAQYVGNKKCAECHSTQHEPYLQTPHSQALAAASTERQPPDGRFHHELSGRSFRVYHEEGRMRHRESMFSNHAIEQDEEVLSDYPVKFVIGSGHHSHSYLIESHGFLIESPITWYTSKEQWLMSPGYDIPQHQSFQRIVDVACLFCHAGRVTTGGDSRNHPKLHEQSIACESCHGPGALHVELREQDRPLADPERDWTIVQPRTMSRREQESICAQCHLAGTVNVEARGRNITEYRPGLSLAEFRIDYGLETPDQSMTVVGHIEQMRMSRCYLQSDKLTCTTCHDPHRTAGLEERVQFFRQKCMECHDSNGCGMPESERRHEDPSDNCAACHMPRSSTEIPHIAFTHHRIGLHETEELPLDDTGDSVLVPLQDVSELPEIERDCSLGLAYLKFSKKQLPNLAKESYRKKSLKLLESVYDRGMRDPDLEEALALIYSELGDHQRGVQFAESTIRHSWKSANGTVNAWVILGNAYLKQNDFERARDVFSKVVELRRASQDWAVLGRCLHETGDTGAGIEALQTASEIDPSRIDIYQALAEFADAMGDTSQANNHRSKANRLLQLSRQK